MLNIKALFGFAKLNCPILKRFAAKIREADRMRDQITTLILGSSHAEKGFRAHSGEMNLGSDFEDLYVSEQLFMRYEGVASLKTVVLFYSVFSPGHDLIMTRDAENAIAFKVAANIPYRDEAYARKLGLCSLERTAYRKMNRHLRKVAMEETYGNEKTYSTNYAKMSPEERALGHLKNNNRGNRMTDYVKMIADAADVNNIRLVIVIPPATSGYRSVLPTSRVLFNELYSIPGLEIVNLFDSPEFRDEDFIDPDHLSLEGAKKLTAILRNEILRRKE